MKPATVSAAANAADDKIRELQALREGGEPPVEPVAEPLEPALSIVPDPLEPEPVAEPVAVTIEEQVVALSKDLETMTARWSSQDGILLAQAKQIETYQALLANMAINKQAEPALQPEPAAPAAPMYTQAQSEVFGEDMAEFVEDLCRKVVRQEVAGMSANMQGLQKTVESTSATVAVTANETFERVLDNLSPGWRALDEDADFMVWLKARPVFGNAIATASQELDAKAAAEIFNTYSTLMGTAPTLDTPAQTTAQLRKQELESQIAPNKALQTPTPAKEVPEEKQWLLSEITAVYKAHQSHNGKPQYTAAEFAALEIEIAAAQRDERVDYSR